VAVIASLHGLLMSGLASMGTSAPRQDTVPAGTADGLLDEVGALIERIFFLASHDDLEVKLWVGSTPAAHARGDKKQEQSKIPEPLLLFSPLPGIGRGSWGEGPGVRAALRRRLGRRP
jgi:hypothetical protein